MCIIVSSGFLFMFFLCFVFCLALLTTLQDSTIRYSISTDGHFLKKPINELIQKQEFHIVPLMTGVNNDEGGFLLGSVSVTQELKSFTGQSNVLQFFNFIWGFS